MSQAENVKAPYEDDADDIYDVLKFTAGTTHGANALPDKWAGRFVRVTVVGGNLHFGFSTDSNAEIDSAVAATAAGATLKVGDYIADGNSEHMLLPSLTPGNKLYFVREASAASTVYLRLASGPPAG